MDLVGKVFGWASTRSVEYNTQEMKSRAESEKEVEAVNRVEVAVKRRNAEFIRKELAE